MADNDQTPNYDDRMTYVVDDNPEAKDPPALETGIFKWMRENLFSSVFNTTLTLIGLFIAIGSLVSFFVWAVQDANWFAIIYNFRQFMVGRYQPLFEWRLQLAVLFVAFATGGAIAVWVRQIRRAMVVSGVVILLTVLAVPPMLLATIPVSPSTMSAGPAEIQSGSVTETALSQVAFIAQEGETVTLRPFSDPAQSDGALSNINGFMDVASNTLRNASITRLDLIAERDRVERLLLQDLSRFANTEEQAFLDEYTGSGVIDALAAAQSALADVETTETVGVFAALVEYQQTGELDALQAAAEDAEGDSVEGAQAVRDALDVVLGELPDLETADAEIPLLTVDQRTQFLSQFEDLQSELADTVPITERYNLNQPAIEVQILSVEGEGEFEPLADATVLDSAEAEATYTIPADGWYLLRKQAVGDDASGVMLLSVDGIYPIFQSTSFSSEVGGFVDTFTRMVNRFSLREQLPRDAEGEDLPFNVIIDNQYRGERPLADYLRVYTAPFLSQIAFGTVLIVAFTALGYGAIEFLRTQWNKNLATQITTAMFVSIPLIVWVMVNGVALERMTVLLGLLFLLVALLFYDMIRDFGSAITNFGTGVAYVIPLLSVVSIGVSVYALLQTDASPATYALVVVGAGVLAFGGYSGWSQYDPDENYGWQTRSLVSGITAVVIYGALFYALQAGFVEVDGSEWILGVSDPRNWGGLLLTMMLTIFGIIVAFPIGVGLALGRRSDLPAIKAICVGYIELIRGSPFITVLFFMQLLIPLINQDFANVPNSYRALIAVIIFSAAYLAENVRGGLQSVPEGQGEAARALGLSGWQTIRLITLPQALRAVIPALVGQFISLFKDTSLVAIVGLIDLTGFVNTMVVQAEFINTRLEGLVFISILYFVFSYVMSYVSRLLEASGSGSTRRM